MSVDFVDKKCVGCGNCVISCKKNAIALRPDNYGFLYPYVDSDRCIECGLCEKNCPELSDYKKTDALEQTYAAWTNNTEILTSSSSGGIFYVMASYVLKNNGYVCGAVYGDDFCDVKHLVTNCKDELKKMQGSKYAQSDLNSCFIEIKELLLSGKMVLFSGTPCQVSACYAFFGDKFDNLFTVSLICHGPMAPVVLSEYIKQMECEKKSKVFYYSMRYKKDNKILPIFYKIQFENGIEEIGEFYNTSIGKIFASNIAMRDSCYNCNYKKRPYIGDIIIGDFKGIEKTSLQNNSMGISTVIVNSRKGEGLLCKIERNLHLEETKLPVVEKYNKRINSSVTRPDEENIQKFWEIFNSKGIDEAAKAVVRKMTPFEKIIDSVKIQIRKILYG